MKARLHSRHDLSSDHLEEMFHLLDQHFEGVTRSRFLADLDTKSNALLLFSDSGKLAGFSTLDFRVTHFRGRDESVVYSGDTIMDPTAWNSTILARAWFEAANNLHAEFGRGPLWWLLITSGFRTYRLLPVFLRKFYPQRDDETPPETRERLNTFARDRFGSLFDPDSGIVRFDHPQRLRQHLAGIPPNRLRDRHVAFFNERNPRHSEGDEIVSVARLDHTNLTSAGLRILEASRRDPVLSAAAS